MNNNPNKYVNLNNMEKKLLFLNNLQCNKFLITCY